MSDMDASGPLCSALSALQITDKDTSDTGTSQPLRSAPTPFQEADHDTFERMGNAWKRMAALGVPKHIITFRPEVLDLRDKGPPPVPDANIHFRERKALLDVLYQDQAIVFDDFRRVVEGLIGWYKDNQSQLSPEACSRIEDFLKCLKHRWRGRNVNWQ